jgi:hypothetical protein
VEEKKEKIGFISSQTEQIWFQLEVKATQPPPIKLPIINAEIGKEKEHVLIFKNPLRSKSIRFFSKLVHAEKDEDLWDKADHTNLKVSIDISKISNQKKWKIIPPMFEIGPKKNKKIRVIYLPDDIEKQDRIGVRFYSDDLGLFEYECYGKGCLPTCNETTFIQSPLNVDYNFNIPFKNPFSENVQVFFKLEQESEQENQFRFKFPEKYHLFIPAFGKIEIPLIFKSSDFGKFKCNLIVSIGENLKWIYPIQIETECDMTNIWPIGKVLTRSDQPIQQKLGFFLDGLVKQKETENDIENEEVFYPENVLNKLVRSKIDFNEIENLSGSKYDNSQRISRVSQFGTKKKQLDPGNLNVPNFEKLSKMKKQSFVKGPKDSMISKYDSIMSLIKNPMELQTNPGRGLIEDKDNSINNEISSIMEEFLSILDNDNIIFEISVQDKKYEHLIQDEWLRARFLQTENRNPGEVSFLFDFHPKKPFSSIATFTIILKTGGRWKFKIFLESTEPKYYDTLNIVTSLNLKKGIQFQVFNQNKSIKSGFKAYFKEDSDTGFEVLPQTGYLYPIDKDGTLFTVTFLPLEYGKTKKAKLVIETSSEYFLFLVKGKFQKYNPPRKKKKNKNIVKFTKTN